MHAGCENALNDLVEKICDEAFNDLIRTGGEDL